MKTYIYKSLKKDGLYLYLAKKDDFSEVPQPLYDSMGNEPQFVMELDLSPDRSLAREDVNLVINNLKTRGFHVQMPPRPEKLGEFIDPKKQHLH
ncbi:YcgL domain-containing protein [Methylophaga sp. OBS4]|uniref:YcgL domain-containing protein n=1 Tax=Methylophaga sp. OBS4 TaxID=2991935 RepID=UPI00224F81D9|nr:YcgL domain-containing protein [Methylophaga sp. OBS4]MCX4186244.1 YcgL domain-containing protein [Methylophaga sp. OBS4]